MRESRVVKSPNLRTDKTLRREYLLQCMQVEGAYSAEQLADLADCMLRDVHEDLSFLMRLKLVGWSIDHGTKFYALTSRTKRPLSYYDEWGKNR